MQRDEPCGVRKRQRRQQNGRRQREHCCRHADTERERHCDDCAERGLRKDQAPGMTNVVDGTAQKRAAPQHPRIGCARGCKSRRVGGQLRQLGIDNRGRLLLRSAGRERGSPELLEVLNQLLEHRRVRHHSATGSKQFDDAWFPVLHGPSSRQAPRGTSALHVSLLNVRVFTRPSERSPDRPWPRGGPESSWRQAPRCPAHR
jgi:hypothetical protein